MNKDLLSFICIEPKENGDLAVIFRCLSSGQQGAVIELSSEQILKRMADYQGVDGLITNFDKLPQVMEFKKALKELDTRRA